MKKEFTYEVDDGRTVVEMLFLYLKRIKREESLFSI